MGTAFSEARLLVDKYCRQAFSHSGLHAGLTGLSPLSVDKDVYEAPHRHHSIASLDKHSNLVRDAGQADFVDAQTELKHRGKADRGQEVAMRMYDEADLTGPGWIERAAVNEIGIDD